MAGGTPLGAARLGVAMTALQAAIGALNDVVDAPRDAGLKPGKPIPAGLVSATTGRLMAAGLAVLGLLLSVPSGPVTTVVGLAVLAVGASYDLRLKGTAWSWLPFAVGIPLLPVYAWLGASGGLPAAFAFLLPAAALAGAALAIANALADLERDRAAGTGSVADRLGAVAAWRLHAAFHLGVLALAAAGWAWLRPAAGPGAPPSILAVIGIVLGVALLAAGTILAAGGSPRRRERGWELEAIGTGLLGASWVAAVVLGRA